MKYTVFLLALLLLVGCQESATKQSDLTPYIPRKAAVIIKVNNWEDFSNALINNALLKEFNSTNLSKTLKSKASLLNKLKPNSEVLLSFVSLGKNEYDFSLITEQHKNLFPVDSIALSKTIQTDYNGSIINATTVDNDSLYYMNTNSKFIASTSRMLLENNIRQQNAEADIEDSSFVRVFKTSDNSAMANVYFKGKEAVGLYKNILGKGQPANFSNTFDWAAFDIDLGVSNVSLNGILTYDKSQKNKLSLLEKTSPTQSKIANILPLDARAAISFGYKNWDNYIKNLAKMRQIPPHDFSLKFDALYSNCDEISSILMDNAEIAVMHSTDREITNEALLSQSTEIEVFRDIPLKKFDDSLALKKDFKELLNLSVVNVYCQIDDYLIFGQNTAILKTVIANYQNNAVLGKSENYTSIAQKLSDEQSLYIIGNVQKIQSYLSENANKDAQKEIKEIDLIEYPFAILQLVAADNFLHFNAIIERNTLKPESGAVSQIASV
ncbi:MAG: hypothetical protein V7767_05370, partial [Leeuwenhoekiella sp.]